MTSNDINIHGTVRLDDKIKKKKQMSDFCFFIRNSKYQEVKILRFLKKGEK